MTEPPPREHIVERPVHSDSSEDSHQEHIEEDYERGVPFNTQFEIIAETQNQHPIERQGESNNYSDFRGSDSNSRSDSPKRPNNATIKWVQDRYLNQFESSNHEAALKPSDNWSNRPNTSIQSNSTIRSNFSDTRSQTTKSGVGSFIRHDEPTLSLDSGKYNDPSAVFGQEAASVEDWGDSAVPDSPILEIIPNLTAPKVLQSNPYLSSKKNAYTDIRLLSTNEWCDASAKHVDERALRTKSQAPFYSQRRHEPKIKAQYTSGYEAPVDEWGDTTNEYDKKPAQSPLQSTLSLPLASHKPFEVIPQMPNYLPQKEQREEDPKSKINYAFGYEAPVDEWGDVPSDYVEYSAKPSPQLAKVLPPLQQPPKVLPPKSREPDESIPQRTDYLPTQAQSRVVPQMKAHQAYGYEAPIDEWGDAPLNDVEYSVQPPPQLAKVLPPPQQPPKVLPPKSREPDEVIPQMPNYQHQKEKIQEDPKSKENYAFEYEAPVDEWGDAPLNNVEYAVQPSPQLAKVLPPPQQPPKVLPPKSREPDEAIPQRTNHPPPQVQSRVEPQMNINQAYGYEAPVDEWGDSPLDNVEYSKQPSPQIVGLSASAQPANVSFPAQPAKALPPKSREPDEAIPQQINLLLQVQSRDKLPITSAVGYVAPIDDWGDSPADVSAPIIKEHIAGVNIPVLESRNLRNPELYSKEIAVPPKTQTPLAKVAQLSPSPNSQHQFVQSGIKYNNQTSHSMNYVSPVEDWGGDSAENYIEQPVIAHKSQARGSDQSETAKSSQDNILPMKDISQNSGLGENWGEPLIIDVVAQARIIQRSARLPPPFPRQQHAPKIEKPASNSLECIERIEDWRNASAKFAVEPVTQNLPSIESRTASPRSYVSVKGLVGSSSSDYVEIVDEWGAAPAEIVDQSSIINDLRASRLDNSKPLQAAQQFSQRIESVSNFDNRGGFESSRKTLSRDTFERPNSSHLSETLEPALLAIEKTECLDNHVRSNVLGNYNRVTPPSNSGYSEPTEEWGPESNVEVVIVQNAASRPRSDAPAKLRVGTQPVLVGDQLKEKPNSGGFGNSRSFNVDNIVPFNPKAASRPTSAIKSEPDRKRGAIPPANNARAYESDFARSNHIEALDNYNNGIIDAFGTDHRLAHAGQSGGYFYQHPYGGLDKSFGGNVRNDSLRPQAYRTASPNQSHNANIVFEQYQQRHAPQYMYPEMSYPPPLPEYASYYPQSYYQPPDPAMLLQYSHGYIPQYTGTTFYPPPQPIPQMMYYPPSGLPSVNTKKKSVIDIRSPSNGFVMQRSKSLSPTVMEELGNRNYSNAPPTSAFP